MHIYNLVSGMSPSKLLFVACDRIWPSPTAEVVPFPQAF